MPSTSPSDPDEVVEVFQGDSLEEAMAAAVAALGPELEVRRARKVRAGVRGLMGRDRYEVLAVPPAGADAPADPDPDPVGSALDALLDAADEREAGGPAAARTPDAAPPRAAPPAARPAPPAPRAGATPPAPPRPVAAVPPPAGRAGRPAPTPEPSPAALPEVLEALLPGPVPAPLPEAPARRRGRALPLAARAPHPDPGVADRPDQPALPRARRRSTEPGEPAALRPEPRRAEPLRAEPEPARATPVHATPVHAEPEPEPREEPARPRTPATEPSVAGGAPVRRSRSGGWSRTALSALGVPVAVLEHLPSPAPKDDLAWVVALTAAIEAAVPDPGEPDERHPVVVSGHGLAGAVAVLDAGSRGVTPGTITHAGRTAPATATELALVLRHHVTSRGA